MYSYVGKLFEVQITSETQNKDAQFEVLLNNRIKEEVAITGYVYYLHSVSQRTQFTVQ